MDTTKSIVITVESTINAPVEKVWHCWTYPVHITKWCFASDDWHTPRAENDIRTGGRFVTRMEAKDGSYGFDFGGVYDKVDVNKLIEYTMDDNRKVKIEFTNNGDTTHVKESFDAEQENSPEMQRDGWQAILNNFKKYTEAYIPKIRLRFEIAVKAPVSVVYNAMIDKKHYSDWTAIFNPTSHFEGSWEKGTKMHFIGESPEGKAGGMVSLIKENIPDRFISIEHLGMIKDGKEITSGKEVEEWAGALENYTFTDMDGNTMLLVEMDSTPEFRSYFEETWPKAMEALKKICEQKA